MTTSQSRWRSYRDVDATRDPSLLSEQLDDIASVPSVAAAKQRSIDLLELPVDGTVLDLGCGNGPELGRLAERVGPGGRVVGLDRSTALIREAEARWVSQLKPIEVTVADAHALPFTDAEFDGCRADRTLQHLAKPDVAVSEMVRVTRPRGRVVATELRWGLRAPGLDQDVTKRIIRVMATDDEHKHWLGHLLPVIFQLAGLTHVQALSEEHSVRDPEELARFINLRWSLDAAVEAGTVTREQGDAWCERLGELLATGGAYLAIVVLHVVGTRP